jgi:DNA adenine methylase
MNSPLNYLGGKSRLADKIVPIFPSDHVCYCEPFCGAAWVLFRKDPSKCEVINDADGELVTFWRVIQNHLEEFLRYYRWAVVARKIWEIENLKNPGTLTDIQRAVRYYYLQRLGFGGKTSGRTFGTSTTGSPRLNLISLEDTLLEVHSRLQRVVIENLTACDCIIKYDRPETLFYIDPPYYNTAGYAVPFKAPADYEKLRDCLASIKGRFLLSINDVKQVRQIFQAFRIQTVSTSYSAGNPRKGGPARSAQIRELLIRNF